MKVILLNAPPGSGKDEVASYLQEVFDDGADAVFVDHAKLAFPLKVAAAALLGHHTVDPRELERMKSQDFPQLKGDTFRSLLIGIAESYIRPNYGSDFFAKALLAEYDMADPANSAGVLIVSDLGFKEEADAFIEACGSDNVIILHIDRPGYDWTIDSRGWVYNAACQHEIIKNDDDLDTLLELSERAVMRWLSVEHQAAG